VRESGIRFTGILRTVLPSELHPCGSTQGKMSLLQAAVTMSEFDGLAYPTKTWSMLIQALVKMLVPFGKLFGHKAC
jgi:hypothetical protein